VTNVEPVFDAGRTLLDKTADECRRDREMKSCEHSHSPY